MSIWTVVLIVAIVGPMVRWSLPGDRRGHRRSWGDEARLTARYDELVGELDRRTAMIEHLEGRVAELENRLDFAERMLASPRLRPTEFAHSPTDSGA